MATLTTPATRRPRADVSATPATRNRAIDAYRAAAMCAVALGHWLAADVRITKGSIAGGNALDKMANLHLLTWAFQVMPLFFCIGGYSNAASLDSHHRAGRSNGSWVRARLLRLTTPSIWLAGTWFALLTAGHSLGVGKLTNMAVGVAAIPLWFLANYVADTALSPLTLRLYRTHGWKFVGALSLVFALGEAARLPGIRFVPQINIVIGWLGFQVLGFAWKDGHLPTGRRLVLVGAGGWITAGTLVAVGPWPLAMVSVPGSRFANTWPPSLALMFYGVGLCCGAIAAAPVISRILTKRHGMWRTVVVANTMTMTSYLWHFTALSIASVILGQFHLLPTAPIGTGGWWVQKLPVMLVALVVLAVIVWFLAPRERSALLGNASCARPSATDSAVATRLTILAAVGLAAGFELWTAAAGRPVMAASGMALVLAVHAGLRHT